MPSAGFEPAIPAIKRPQTYALDRAATGIGQCMAYLMTIITMENSSKMYQNVPKVRPKNWNNVIIVQIALYDK
jgi:hypothetical protein